MVALVQGLPAEQSAGRVSVQAPLESQQDPVRGRGGMTLWPCRKMRAESETIEPQSLVMRTE